MTVARENHYEQPSLIYFLAEHLSILWKDWPANMEVTTLGSNGDIANFSLNGKCPHCDERASLTMVFQPAYREPVFEASEPHREIAQRIAAILQCPGCKKFVLAVVTRNANQVSWGQPSREPFIYEAHYPMGSPNDSVENGIPPEIGEDFKEALRCQWVKSYKASVCMCRRALEASCLALGAPKSKDLQGKIDSLAKKGTISNILKDLAQRIRLTGNRGAHAPKNEQQKAEDITPEHVEALIAFTRQFFQHVYVMPFELNKFADGSNKVKP